MNLQEFLNNNPVEGMTAEVLVSERFRDASGALMKFKIKAILQPEFEALRKKATKISIEKGVQKVAFDSDAFNMELIINHTLDPNFRDAESIKRLGCTTPEQYINKVLMAGEIQELNTQISKFSGFDVNINMLVGEAKN